MGMKYPFDLTDQEKSSLTLHDGDRVGVIGGGPAGSFYTYFLLEMAQRVGLDLRVDIYENQDFFRPGPGGCNMCGGIVSESLVQMLATEGINLPPGIIQRGIDSYQLHTDEGSVNIAAPLQEKRIGAVHRGAGPRDATETRWGSFDGFLQILAIEKGAFLHKHKVNEILWQDNKPQIRNENGGLQTFDLLAVAVGVNTTALDLFKEMNIGYVPPRMTKTLIREYFLGEEIVNRWLGHTMHVYLLEIPNVEFAAIIPKGDYVTLCLLGEDLNNDTLQIFLNNPEVRNVFPPEINLETGSCRCLPRMNISGSSRPFGDRIIFIGDCGVTRLYKDGIGAAYRVAKSAASTSVFQGINAESFEKYYWPACRKILWDNRVGKLVFLVSSLIQKFAPARRAVTKMIIREQKTGRKPMMSSVLWDMFTGSASYVEIFLRTLHPVFVFNLLRYTMLSLFKSSRPQKEKGPKWVLEN